MTASTVALAAALDAGRGVRAIVLDVDGQRHDGVVEVVFGDESVSVACDDGDSLTVDPRDVIEWEVVD